MASLFKAVGLTERYGSGIKRIEDACRRHGGVRVEFENHETWFKVVLSKVDGEKRTGENPQNKLGEKLGERLGEKLGERRNKILQVLKADSTVAIPAIATIIGVSETAIEKNLSWLRENGYIRRIGGARGGHWEVLKH